MLVAAFLGSTPLTQPRWPACPAYTPSSCAGLRSPACGACHARCARCAALAGSTTAPRTTRCGGRGTTGCCPLTAGKDGAQGRRASALKHRARASWRPLGGAPCAGCFCCCAADDPCLWLQLPRHALTLLLPQLAGCKRWSCWGTTGTTGSQAAPRSQRCPQPTWRRCSRLGLSACCRVLQKCRPEAFATRRAPLRLR